MNEDLIELNHNEILVSGILEELVSLPADINIDQIARIQFYSYRGKDEAPKWFSAIDC